MPFFVGRFDLDSARIAGRWVSVATYPSTMLAGTARQQFWDELRQIFPAEIAVTGETPFDRYTVEIVFDSSYAGASALEHQSSHMGIYTPYIIGNPVLPSITAHEIFHLWNVKRMRPAGMVPYRYDRPEPTPWLWVSEGITDYYADLALVRGGIIDSTGFLDLTQTKISNVAATPAVSLEDASLTTWVHPRDGTEYSYYDKGSLAGLLLDIMIRDASDNQHSLDDVMRDVYQSTYEARHRGFTSDDWWGAVSRAAGGRSFADFYSRYIDGREPFPYATVFPLAGLQLRTDSTREPRIGVYTQGDSAGSRVVQVDSGSAAAAAGVQPGDILVRVGDVPASDPTFGAQFRARYGGEVGQSVPLTIIRQGRTLTLPMTIRLTTTVSQSLLFDRNASPKAARIRAGLLRGR
jgi:predicted metalloprotease with PDZ domain